MGKCKRDKQACEAESKHCRIDSLTFDSFNYICKDFEGLVKKRTEK